MVTEITLNSFGGPSGPFVERPLTVVITVVFGRTPSPICIGWCRWLPRIFDRMDRVVRGRVEVVSEGIIEVELVDFF